MLFVRCGGIHPVPEIRLPLRFENFTIFPHDGSTAMAGGDGVIGPCWGAGRTQRVALNMLRPYDFYSQPH